MKTLKQKKCKNCGEVFTPYRPLSVVCSVPCAAELSKKQRIVKANKEWKDHVKKVSPSVYSKEYKSELQKEINKLARMIDERFEITTCIDCGKPFGNQTDAAHFTSIGSHPAVRYHLDNLHSASSHCNRFSDKHHSGYELGLETRYGIEYLIDVASLPGKYPKLKLSEVEVVDKLKIVRKIIRDFETFTFESPTQARTLLNEIIGIYK